MNDDEEDRAWRDYQARQDELGPPRSSWGGLDWADWVALAGFVLLGVALICGASWIARWLVR